MLPNSVPAQNPWPCYTNWRKCADVQTYFSWSLFVPPKKRPGASLGNLVKQFYQRHLHGQRHTFPRLRSAATNDHCSIRKCLHQCLKHHQQAVDVRRGAGNIWIISSSAFSGWNDKYNDNIAFFTNVDKFSQYNVNWGKCREKTKYLCDVTPTQDSNRHFLSNSSTSFRNMKINFTTVDQISDVKFGESQEFEWRKKIIYKTTLFSVRRWHNFDVGQKLIGQQQGWKTHQSRNLWKNAQNAVTSTAT